MLDISKGNHHIFDGQVEYWNSLNEQSKNRKDKCLVKQKFVCNHCRQTFKHDSVIELDHIIPKSCGGNEQSTNLQVLYRHCHDIKTRTDGSIKRLV